MLNGQKIVVVMPAYNAARTLRQTFEEVMAQGIRTTLEFRWAKIRGSGRLFPPTSSS